MSCFVLYLVHINRGLLDAKTSIHHENCNQTALLLHNSVHRLFACPYLFTNVKLKEGLKSMHFIYGLLTQPTSRHIYHAHSKLNK